MQRAHCTDGGVDGIVFRPKRQAVQAHMQEARRWLLARQHKRLLCSILCTQASTHDLEKHIRQACSCEHACVCI